MSKEKKEIKVSGQTQVKRKCTECYHYVDGLLLVIQPADFHRIKNTKHRTCIFYPI